MSWTEANPTMPENAAKITEISFVVSGAKEAASRNACAAVAKGGVCQTKLSKACLRLHYKNILKEDFWGIVKALPVRLRKTVGYCLLRFLLAGF